ncbi:MAG TPA: insulinase family protein [Allosphingosinicella sp.]
MRDARRLLGLLLILLWAAPLAAQLANPPPPSPEARAAWGFDRTDLPPDPAVRFGVLANGMRYAIMRNANPAHAASLRLRIAVGAADDPDDALGMAHFLEHMAFMGSAHLPEGRLATLMERRGLMLGPDINANTSAVDTNYKLDLPQVGGDMVDTALMVMRETASELSLTPAAVERARPIVLNEIRAAADVDAALAGDQAAFFIPGAPAARGPVTGSEAGVRAIDAAALRAMYERTYVPTNAVLVLVGDVDPVAAEALIAARFGDWTARPAPVRAQTRIDPDRPTATRLFVDPAAPTAVAIAAAGPLDPRADGAALRNQRFNEYLASNLMNRRLARLADAQGARFYAASSGLFDLLFSARMAQLNVTANGGDWRGALAAGEQELRRAIQHGFSQAELDEQVRAERETLAAEAENRRSTDLADTIAAMQRTGTVFTALPNRSEARTYLAGIRLADVNAAFRAAWARPGRLIHVSHSAPIADAERAIAAAWAESGRTAVAPLEVAAIRPFAYADFGPAGPVAADARIADLGIRTLRFANNVRLNIRRTDLEPGRVRVSLRVGGGMRVFPQAPDGLASFMASAFAGGGTVAHSQDELRSIMAGRTLGLGFDVLADAFGGTRETTPQDLETQLDILAAYLTAPGFRAEAEARWRSSLAAWYPSLDESPQGILTRDVDRIVAGGDTRFGIGPRDGLERLDFAALRPVIAESFARAPIEIGIVGDIDEDAAIRAVARSFGALPTRRDDSPAEEGPAPHFPADRTPITLTHRGAADDALVAVYWPSPGERDPREAARLDLLRAVVAIRVRERVREALGAAYSPLVAARRWPAWPDYGYLTVQTSLTPDKVAEVEGAILAIAAELAAAPVDEELLARARNPMLERLDRGRRDNRGWLEVVAVAQGRPGDLDRIRQADTVLRSITAAELRETARRYLQPGAALKVRILPVALP